MAAPGPLMSSSSGDPGDLAAGHAEEAAEEAAVVRSAIAAAGLVIWPGIAITTEVEVEVEVVEGGRVMAGQVAGVVAAVDTMIAVMEVGVTDEGVVVGGEEDITVVVVVVVVVEEEEEEEEEGSVTIVGRKAIWQGIALMFRIDHSFGRLL